MKKNVEKPNENVKVVPQSNSYYAFLKRGLTEKEYFAFRQKSVFEKYGRNLLSSSTFPDAIKKASNGRLAAEPISYPSLSSIAVEWRSMMIGRRENVEEDLGPFDLKISFDFSDLPPQLRKTLINNVLPSILLEMREYYSSVLHGKTRSEIADLFNSWIASSSPNVYLVSRQEENAQASFRADSTDLQNKFFCIHMRFPDKFEEIKKSIESILPKPKSHLFLVVSSSRQTDDLARGLANLIANVAGQEVEEEAEVIVFPYEQNPSKKEGSNKQYQKLLEENKKLKEEVLKFSQELENSSKNLENALIDKERLINYMRDFIKSIPPEMQSLLQSLHSVLSEAKFGNRAEKIKQALEIEKKLEELKYRIDEVYRIYWKKYVE